MSGVMNPTLMLVLAGMLSALSIGTVARLVALHGAAEDVVRTRLSSLKTWWVLATVLGFAVAFGAFGVVVLLGVASWIGLREFLDVTAFKLDRVSRLIAFACIPVNYLLIYLNLVDAFVVFVPLTALLLVASVRAAAGHTVQYVSTSGSLHWGLMLILYGLSHAALLFTLPGEANPSLGPVGWFLYVVILTETNDIAQAIVGRAIGRHEITPVTSPKKTWEGFLGGWVVTTLLAGLLGAPLTSLELHIGPAGYEVPFAWAIISGAVISVSGFLGDINMSAVKRDAGVKDSSRMLPGQGGLLDRVDSLTFSAPAFYYLVRAVIS